MHIDDLSIRRWLRERMESTQNRIALSHEVQVRILSRLTDAVIFEEFVAKKFLGSRNLRGKCFRAEEFFANELFKNYRVRKP